MTILELLQYEKLEPHVQGRHTRIIVSPGPHFEVLGAIRQGGPYTINLYSGQYEGLACEVFMMNEENRSNIVAAFAMPLVVCAVVAVLEVTGR